MEEQKTGRGFIVFFIFSIICLLIYLCIYYNWFHIDYSIFDDFNFTEFEENFFDDNLPSGNLSLSFDVKMFPETLTVGEYSNISIKIVSNGEIVKDFTGLAILWLYDENGDLVDNIYYSVPNDGRLEFELADQGEKEFVNGLRIDKVGKYAFVIEDIFRGVTGSYDIVVRE